MLAETLFTQESATDPLQEAISFIDEEKGVETIEVPLSANDSMLRLLSHVPITELYGFDDGLFFVQDFAAASVIKGLSPQPGWVVVDLCAAPGTKSLQLARMMNDNGTIIGINYGMADIRKNAFLYGSNRTGTGFVDGRASGKDVKFRDNLIRYNRYAGFMDSSNNWIIDNNLFIENDSAVDLVCDLVEKKFGERRIDS